MNTRASTTDHFRHAAQRPRRFRPSGDRATTLESVLVWTLLVIDSTRVLVFFASRDLLFPPLDSPLLYQAGTIAFNYFEFGAVRRGLGGTIAHLLADDMLAATVRFHLLSAALVCAGACALYRRMRAPPMTRIAYVAALFAIVDRWSFDMGRTDMLVCALFAAATLAVLRRRPLVAFACICVGLFVHESSFFFGLPLLASLLWRVDDPRAWPRSRQAALVALFIATLAVYAALSALPHLDREATVALVRSKLPLFKHVDWAIYFAQSGLRGVEMSICQNATDASYWLHPVGGLLVVTVVFVACAWCIAREWWWAALAALPGFVALSIVANDIARWTMFASFAVWLVQCATAVRDSRPDLRPWVGAFLGIAAIQLADANGGRPDVIYPIYAGSPYFEMRMRRHGVPPTPSVEDAFARCDPYWHDVLGDPPLIDP